MNIKAIITIIMFMANATVHYVTFDDDQSRQLLHVSSKAEEAKEASAKENVIQKMLGDNRCDREYIERIEAIPVSYRDDEKLNDLTMEKIFSDQELRSILQKVIGTNESYIGARVRVDIKAKYRRDQFHQSHHEISRTVFYLFDFTETKVKLWRAKKINDALTEFPQESESDILKLLKELLMPEDEPRKSLIIFEQANEEKEIQKGTYTINVYNVSLTETSICSCQ